MEFGVQFFPDVKPEEKSARDYFAESLEIAEEAERLGFTHARIVEHYFHYYGGYSPNPMLFLSAASQRTKRMRLVTGAVLPVFNNPLKLAGEIGMLDAISNGRLDVGFARAFLPHEFRRFGVSPNESIERYREGIEQVDLLLRGENVTHRGKFHTIEKTTSLPRPTQQPRPKFYVAALTTPESFEFAGRMGYSVMAIPMAGGKMRELLGLYRKAWHEALPRLRQGHRQAQGRQHGIDGRERRGVDRLAARDHRGDRRLGAGLRPIRARLAADQFQRHPARGGTRLPPPLRHRGSAAFRQWPALAAPGNPRARQRTRSAGSTPLPAT